MFSRYAFRSHRIPPVPEAFPKTQGKQREDNEKEEAQSSTNHPVVSRPPNHINSGLGDMIIEGSSSAIGKNTGLKPLVVLAEAAALRRIETETSARRPIESEDLNQVEKTSSIAARKNHKFEMVANLAIDKAILPDRETLCAKIGEMVGEDRTEFTIYPMLDIEHSDEAMIIRVKDLLGPSVSMEDVVLGGPFVAEYDQGMAIVDDESLCGILVTTRSARGKVRVADLANLKKRREQGFVGYEEVDVNPKESWGSRVMIVKRGQNAVIEGRPTLRLFLRVRPGTSESDALTACLDAWMYRQSISHGLPPVWHEYFTQGGK